MTPLHLSDRERIALTLSSWAATLLGPFPDEVGWGAVTARWILLGAAAGLATQGFLQVNLWEEIAWCIAFVLFTIAALTG